MQYDNCIKQHIPGCNNINSVPGRNEKYKYMVQGQQ